MINFSLDRFARDFIDYTDSEFIRIFASVLLRPPISPIVSCMIRLSCEQLELLSVILESTCLTRPFFLEGDLERARGGDSQM